MMTMAAAIVADLVTRTVTVVTTMVVVAVVIVVASVAAIAIVTARIVTNDVVEVEEEVVVVIMTALPTNLETVVDRVMTIALPLEELLATAEVLSHVQVDSHTMTVRILDRSSRFC